MLKKLFYVSASILMLALAYHLGATTATAQVPGNPITCFGGPQTGEEVALTSNGDVYDDQTCSPTGNTWRLVGNVSASSGHASGPFVAVGYYGCYLRAFAVNGDVFQNTSFDAPAGSWTFLGNIFGTPTPSAQPTWGSLKARYR